MRQDALSIPDTRAFIRSNDTLKKTIQFIAWLGLGPFLIVALQALIGGAHAKSSSSSLAQSTATPVHVQLRSPWQAAPLLLELLESAHDEDPKIFFPLLDHLHAYISDAKHQVLSLTNLTDETLFERVQDIIEKHGFLIEPGQRQTWHASLALRAELPKIAAHWQLYNTSGLNMRLQQHIDNTGDVCASWVDWNGKVLCTIAQVQQAIQQLDSDANASESSTTFHTVPAVSLTDHVLCTAADPTAVPTAVLYADSHSNDFWDLHAALKRESSRIQYVLRWKPTEHVGHTYLSGFDAYLDLKKVDYLVIDDRKLIDTATLQNLAVKEDPSIKSQSEERMNLAAAKHDVEDRKWLNKHLRATESDHRTSMGNLTKEEVQQLGANVAYAIMTSSDRLRAMKQLSQDFPSHAVALARSAGHPDKSFVREIETMQYMTVEEGAEVVFLNGKMMSEREFHPFGLLTALREERRLMRSLASLGLSSKEAYGMLTTSPPAEIAYHLKKAKHDISPSSIGARSAMIERVTNDVSSFTIGNVDSATLRFTVLIDPVGRSVQKWSGTLQMLAQQSDVSIHVVLNPTLNISEVPLKRYYRTSAPSQLVFDKSGKLEPSLLAFNDMPKEAVLTMGLDAPPSWLTMPVEAIYDLDNIRLRDAVTTSVQALYDLKYILIEGHARDESSRSAPRGLQLVLETMDGSQTLDTIVMANLAYFQFRASPGVYRLRIREGRSDELYEMISAGNAGWYSPTLASKRGHDVITLDTFQGVTIYPRFSKRRNMELERLVVDEEPNAATAHEEMSNDINGHALSADAIWNRAQNVISSLGAKLSMTTSAPSSSGHSVAAKRQADINVFTVASGHLYERMTYIMILSTLKNTKHTVKFWFIENFLSPSFKSFIPLLAQEYDFEYELITYTWPHWLRSQSEKQREIWGMKVLFLDVLFPLSLSKVIFVDADQIVRADLMELIKIDLHGAPYGFAPMGNDSYDMDNFRFWETGYWKTFLRGKPYPISALFVVDLNQFRLVAAGDKLRGHYQALSADPGSLSNLDQDLVASMIHYVPIFSLPREWLWCETWCSWEWYDAAKSIDLCSNPKTHEPKLDRARRQIPEWVSLDEEVAALARRLEEQGKLGANVVASTGSRRIEKSQEQHLPKPMPISNPSSPFSSFSPSKDGKVASEAASHLSSSHDEL